MSLLVRVGDDCSAEYNLYAGLAGWARMGWWARGVLGNWDCLIGAIWQVDLGGRGGNFYDGEEEGGN